MSNNQIHVVPNGGDGWRAFRPDGERNLVVGETKQEVLDRAREIARNTEAELVIHNKDGRISDSDSYGPDHNPPRDRVH